MKLRSNWLVLAILTSAVVTFSASTSEAAFKVRVTGPGPFDSSITDNGAGDADPTTGAILGSIIVGGGNSVSFGESLSKPVVGGTPDFSELSTSGSGRLGNGTWRILVTDTSFFMSPGVNNLALLTSALNNLTRNSGSVGTISNVSFKSYVNYGAGGNNEFGGTSVNATPGGSVSQSGNVTIPGSSSSGYVLIDGGPFSFSNELTFTISGGVVNFSFTTDSALSTPAPAGLVLALTALPLLGLGRRFLGRRQAV